MDLSEFQEQSNHGFVVEFQNNMKGHLSPANDYDYTMIVKTDADFRLFSNNWRVEVSKENTDNHNINKFKIGHGNN